MTSEKYHQIIDRVNLSGLNGKSVFMTGGTGFFGYWLVALFNHLNENGIRVGLTLLSRNPETFIEKHPEFAHCSWLQWVKGDVVSYRFPEQRFDFVVHGAANTTPLVYEKPATVFEEICSGTKRVLDHAIKSGASRVLLLSSGAVYGEVSKDTLFIPENYTGAPETNNPGNAYGEAKRASEMLGFSYAKEYGLEVISARCFAFAGKGIGEHLVLNLFIQQALNAPGIEIRSSGTARRSFLHGRDLAIWLLKLLVDGNGGEIYNVGSDKAHTIKELAELVRDLIAPGKDVKVLGSSAPEQRVNYIPSVKKAKELGLEVWTSLEDAIKEMQTEKHQK